MAQPEVKSILPNCDAYFEVIQSRKRLPFPLQESLTAALAQIPISSFPQVPNGKVIEISADMSVVEAVKVLSQHNIMAAPVRNPEAGNTTSWKERYLGVLDYSAIILWVIENAELAAVALSAGNATAAGVGVGAVGALGAMAVGLTGPAAIAGLTITAVGAAVAGGVAAESGVGKDAPTAADHMGEDFYKVILEEEPFKSTTVKSIVESYRWSPFIPVSLNSSMLTVLLLLSKYRLRNVPVIEVGNPCIKNFITQTAVVQGLKDCEGRDWFDCIAARPLTDLGLPFMSYDEVISIKDEELILEAFKRMKDNRIGGLPVTEGTGRKIVGSVSIRDIRFLLLRPELFSSFRHLTVMDFMRKVGLGSPGTSNESVTPPVTCPRDALLGGVIETLASKAVHRIYVVEDDNILVGVVTLRDVISCFIYEPPNHFDNCFGAAKEILSQ